MSRSISSTVSKRVPGQYHLTRHNQSTYKGLPVLSCKEGYVSEYLERLLCTLNRATQKHSKSFAIRIDLHFPQYYSSIGHEVLSNEYLQSFIKFLNRQLKKYKDQKKRLGQRVHDVDFEYAWARESGPKSGKPHFHLLLLFNGHTFNTLGHFSNDCESLYNRIGTAWAEALKMYPHEGVQFVRFIGDAQYHLHSGNEEQLAELFRRASYLAKLVTKNFHDGYHVFGSSRV